MLVLELMYGANYIHLNIWCKITFKLIELIFYGHNICNPAVPIFTSSIVNGRFWFLSAVSGGNQLYKYHSSHVSAKTFYIIQGALPNSSNSNGNG